MVVFCGTWFRHSLAGNPDPVCILKYVAIPYRVTAGDTDSDLYAFSFFYRCASYQLMLQATGNKQHVAFTRILHRTQPDGLMAEVTPQHMHTNTQAIESCFASAKNPQLLKTITEGLLGSFTDKPTSLRPVPVSHPLSSVYP